MIRAKALIAGATILSLTLGACNWTVKPTYPASQIVSALEKMCEHDYHMTVDARVQGDSLQIFFWRVGLLKNGDTEMRADAADALERVLLCATRIALSTDAKLQFVEVKMMDVLSGESVTLWRYVPDIRDSMYNRIAEDEYINRLVMEMAREGSGDGEQDHTPHWDQPTTMKEFVAKQIVLRAKREAPAGLQAHEDLSKTPTLTVVIDTWPPADEKNTDEDAKVPGLFEKAARDVMHGYQFNGFRELVLKDSHGLSLGKWTF